MKILIFIVFTSTTVYQINSQLQKYSNFEKDTVTQTLECAMELWPKAIKIPALYDLQQLPENNELLNKIWGCIWIKKELLDKNGNIDKDNIIGFIGDMIDVLNKRKPNVKTDFMLNAREVAEICESVRGINYGDKAIKTQNCINSLMTRNYSSNEE